jgi:hypothetical protein
VRIPDGTPRIPRSGVAAAIGVDALAESTSSERFGQSSLHDFELGRPLSTLYRDEPVLRCQASLQLPCPP